MNELYMAVTPNNVKQGTVMVALRVFNFYSSTISDGNKEGDTVIAMSSAKSNSNLIYYVDAVFPRTGIIQSVKLEDMRLVNDYEITHPELYGVEFNMSHQDGTIVATIRYVVIVDGQQFWYVQTERGFFIWVRGKTQNLKTQNL